MGDLIERAATDLHLAMLFAQLRRRGLSSLIPYILGGARYQIERGRLWVFVDSAAGVSQPDHQ